MPFISGITQNNKLYIFLCYILYVYLFVVELFCLVARFTGEVDTDFAQGVDIHLRKDDARMHFAAAQVNELAHGVGAAMGLVTAQMDRATSTSSVCRRGLWLPR